MIITGVQIWTRRFGTARGKSKLAWGCLPLFILLLACSIVRGAGQAAGLIVVTPTVSPALTAPVVPTKAVNATPTLLPAAASATIAPATSPTPNATQQVAPTARGTSSQAGSYPSLPAGLASAQVVRVIDGDTVDVSINGATERLRLLGIDTPETKHPSKPVECFGIEASNKAGEMLDRQTVYLEDDVSQDSRDRYGRRLSYLWLPNGRMFNLEMVAQGYAYEYTYRLPYKYQAEFKGAQADAAAQGRGLWAATTCNGEHKPAAGSNLHVPAAPPTGVSAPASELPVAPAPQPATNAGGGNCDPAYPGVCIPPAPPDLDCGDVQWKRFRVVPPDPHRFDRDNDGIGCES